MSAEDVDLSSELKAEQKKLNELRAKIRAEKLKKQKDALNIVEKKELTDGDKALLKAAFEKFDADKSGSISLEELKNLSKELGVEMSENDAQQNMKDLDKNGDGTLSFDEFAEWWSSDANRGGNKGLALTLLKKRLQATLFRDSAIKRMQASQVQADDSVPMTVETTVTVGNPSTDEDTEAPSSLTAIVMPSTEQRFKGMLKDDEPEDLLYVIEITGEVVDGTSESELKELCEQATEFLKFLGEILGDEPKLSVVATPSADNKQVVFRVIISGDEDGDPMANVKMMLKAAGAEKGLNDFFESAYLSIHTGKPLEGLCRWEDPQPLTDILEDARTLTSVRLNRNLINAVVGGMIRANAVEDPSKLVAAVALGSVERYQSNQSYANISELREKVVNSITNVPLTFLAENDELLKLSDEENNEVLEVLRYMREETLKVLRMFDTANKINPPFLLAMAFSEDFVENFSEDPTLLNATIKLLSKLENLASVTVNNSIAGTRVTFRNLPFFKMFREFDTAESYVATRNKFMEKSSASRKGVGIRKSKIEELFKKLMSTRKEDPPEAVEEAFENFATSLKQTAMASGALVKTVTGKDVLISDDDEDEGEGSEKPPREKPTSRMESAALISAYSSDNESNMSMDL